ncbi:MAG: GGDEF domain-containing protein [Lachnospiraceae bacterium]|nr:GGDEF domain-containing protein [Lachnospiraceae bacterium]
MIQARTVKMTYIVNTVILFMVFGLLAFFKAIDAAFLVYFSIPTAFIYIIGFYLIGRGKLSTYVWMVYLWLTIYMGVTTVCLGYSFGFHLYCMSMIPIMFVSEYMAYRIDKKSLKAVYVSLGVAAVYLLSTGYVSHFGPVYERDEKVATVFWLMNSILVFGFLIFYTDWLIKLIIQSEEKLKEIAHIDKLTGLYNRHYMMEILNNEKGNERFLAIADIDLFKNINDNYGHNSGDHVLKTIARILKEGLDSADICRWGGEEFLLLAKGDINKGREVLENLRKRVENEDLSFEGKEIRATITIGGAVREENESVDKWIQRADEKLYIGKGKGRNKVEI